MSVRAGPCLSAPASECTRRLSVWALLGLAATPDRHLQGAKQRLYVTLNSAPIFTSASLLVRGAITCLLLVAVLGCNRAPIVSDTASLFLQPGVGISNVCEVGMTYREIKRTTGDAATHGLHDKRLTLERFSSSRFLLVPSLGVIGVLEDNEMVSHLEFFVTPYNEGAIPSLKVEKPFRGKVGGIDFSNGPVTRRDVESIFGVIYSGTTNLVLSGSLLEKNEPFWFLRSDDSLELWYPAEGVIFVLQRDRVSSIRIFRSTRHTGSQRHLASAP